MQDDEKWSSSHALRGLIFMNSKFRVIEIPHVEIWKCFPWIDFCKL